MIEKQIQLRVMQDHKDMQRFSQFEISVQVTVDAASFDIYLFGLNFYFLIKLPTQ